MRNVNKLWVVLSLIIVFAAGLAGGILLDQYILRKPRSVEKKKSSVHFPTLETMAEELRLTAEQRETIRGFFEKSEDEFKTLRSNMRSHLSSMRKRLIEDIKNVLDEDQRSQFQAMLDEYLSLRKKEIERQMKHSDRSRHEKRGRS